MSEQPEEVESKNDSKQAEESLMSSIALIGDVTEETSNDLIFGLL